MTARKTPATAPAQTPHEKLLASLLSTALKSGAKGDDLVKIFLDSDELAAAIILAHAQKALEGSVPSTDWLFKRGLGTPVKKTSNAKQAIDMSIFGSPLDQGDDIPYE